MHLSLFLSLVIVSDLHPLLFKLHVHVVFLTTARCEVIMESRARDILSVHLYHYIFVAAAWLWCQERCVDSEIGWTSTRRPCISSNCVGFSKGTLVTIVGSGLWWTSVAREKVRGVETGRGPATTKTGGRIRISTVVHLEDPDGISRLNVYRQCQTAGLAVTQDRTSCFGMKRGKQYWNDSGIGTCDCFDGPSLTTATKVSGVAQQKWRFFASLVGVILKITLGIEPPPHHGGGQDQQQK